MREVRPLAVALPAVDDSLFPTDLVRLREGRAASSSAASCSLQRALTSLARRRGNVAYMSSVCLLSRVSVPPSLTTDPPSLVSPGASFTRRRRPKLPYLSAVAAAVASFSGRASFLRVGAVLVRPSASVFFLRPRVLLRASSRLSTVLVRVWAWVWVSRRASWARAQGRRSPTPAVLRAVPRGVLLSSLLDDAAMRGVPRGVLPRLLWVLPLSLRGEVPVTPRLFSGVLGESVEVLGELRPEEPRGEVGEVRAELPATRAVSLFPGRVDVERGGGEVEVGASGGEGELSGMAAITVSKVSVREERVLSSREAEDTMEEVREHGPSEACPREAGPLERIMLASSSASASTSSFTASRGSRNASSWYAITRLVDDGRQGGESRSGGVISPGRPGSIGGRGGRR